MSEAREQKEEGRGEWWLTPAVIIGFIVLRAILEPWLAEPAATGVATLAAMLTLYRFVPAPG